jgi:Right handed beta helix region
LTIKGCAGRGVNFENNRLSAARDATVQDCQTPGANNGGENGGGARISGGECTVERCSFLRNTATQSGGGIALRNGAVAAVTSCTFVSNSATRYGGGVDLQDGGGQQIQRRTSAQILNSTFTDNTCTSRDGAAIHFSSSDSNAVTGCTFTRNVAGRRGGACRGQAVYSTSSFIENEAQGDGENFGGGGVSCGMNCVISDCSFLRNTAFSSGGAIMIIIGWNAQNSYGNASITRCDIRGNRVTRTNYHNPIMMGGGGVFLIGGKPVIEDSVISNNSIIVGGGGGIGTRWQWCGTYSCPAMLTVDRCVITSNSAEGGGGVRLFAQRSNVGPRFDTTEIRNSVVSRNTATNNGAGGVETFGELLYMENVTVEENQGWAGGVWIRPWGDPNFPSGAVVRRAQIRENYARARCGGVYANDADVALHDTVVSHNTAVNHGGGMCSDGTASLLLENCAVRNNSAGTGEGGGASVRGNSLNITLSKFVGNSAGNIGGGMTISGVNSGLYVGCTDIVGNTANWGAGIYLDNTVGSTPQTRWKSYWRNVRISENRGVANGGGGVYCWASLMDLEETSISENIPEDLSNVCNGMCTIGGAGRNPCDATGCPGGRLDLCSVCNGDNSTCGTWLPKPADSCGCLCMDTSPVPLPPRAERSSPASASGTDGTLIAIVVAIAVLVLLAIVAIVIVRRRSSQDSSVALSDLKAEDNSDHLYGDTSLAAESGECEI